MDIIDFAIDQKEAADEKAQRRNAASLAPASFEDRLAARLAELNAQSSPRQGEAASSAPCACAHAHPTQPAPPPPAPRRGFGRKGVS